MELESDFRVIGEIGDGLIVIKQVETLQPDILVCDLMIGGMNGLEVTRQLSKRAPKTKMVILSMYGNDGYVYEAIQTGAMAYVLKESTANELIRAIHEVVSGRRYLSPPLSDKAIDNYALMTVKGVLDSYDTLTRREREVLHLIAQRYTNVEIAERLFISRRTVEVHRARLMQKIGLRTLNDLFRYTTERGILLPKP